jgi:hypothetical protein
VSVESFTLLRGLIGVTVRMPEDGFDERIPETPCVTRGSVTRLDLGEDIGCAGTSNEAACGVILEDPIVHCSGDMDRREALVSSVDGRGSSAADRGSLWPIFSNVGGTVSTSLSPHKSITVFSRKGVDWASCMREEDGGNSSMAEAGMGCKDDTVRVLSK